MITRRTKIQLVIFALITMIGVSFVGARYARLDRLVFDKSYAVTAHFTESGGIFTGAEVAYRGVTVGQVSDMKLTDQGVDVVLNIEKKYEDIPRRTKAVVANRSAVGEQYVDLQPETKQQPLPRGRVGDPDRDDPDADRDHQAAHRPRHHGQLGEQEEPDHGRRRARRRVQGHRPRPRPDRRHLRLVHPDARTTTSTSPRRCSRTATPCSSTQIDKTSAIKSFSRDLALFSTTVANSDARPPHGDRERQRHRQPAAVVPGGEQGRPRAADQQPGHHRRGHRPAPRRHRDDPGRLPLRGGRRLHGGRQGQRAPACTTPTSA